jgi:rare lipoprotein A
VSRALPLLIVLMLTACGRAPTRPSPPPPGAPPASAPGAGSPTARGARPDRPGEYTAGGLYRPGVADSGPPVPPDISGLKEPEPQDEPRARYGNRTPYTVLGRSYHVMPSARGYRERGIASWYGEKFHGRATSSLEPYDMYSFTAAHKTLPLPTYARVTNLDNGRSVVVRVNDRGPFHAGRIIDLSYAAAIKLGIHIRGTGNVEVQALVGDGERAAQQTAQPSTRPSTRPASTPVRSVATTAPRSSFRTWLQVASFGEKDNAKRLADRLRDADVDDVDIQRAKVRDARVYRVRIGPFDLRHAAESVAARVRALGLGQPTLVAE